MRLRPTVAALLPTASLLAALPWGPVPAAHAAPATASTAAATPLPASLARTHASSRALAEALGGDKTPENEIVSVATESKAAWTKRADGAWIAPATPRPWHDVLTLTITPKSAGAFLRLDFPTDASLPAGGPGQAGNGNSIIGEVEVEVAGQRVKAQAYSSLSQSNGGRVAATAFDGIRQQGDKGWETETSGWELGPSQPAQLVVQLDKPVVAGTPLTVRLIAKSKWGHHVPGSVSAAVVGGDKAAKAAAQFDALHADFLRFGEAVRDAGRRDDAALAKAELLRAAGEAPIWAILRKKDGYAFLTTFLADQPWLESFLLGGQEGTTRVDFAQSLDNLRLLFAQLPRDTWSDPVSKRLATAMAVQAGAMNRYRFVERFRLIEKARAEGRLHAGFDQLDVRAMRHAVNLGGTPFEFDAWLTETQFTAGGYLGACWAVPYTDPSTYGYSIQGWGFHTPLWHAYPAARLFRSIGGVCGTLSGFGATSALTHGVPAFTVGQPGHCAYVVRLGDQWATGNDVSGPHSNSWTAYENAGFVTTNALLEKTENAREYLPAQRLLWTARAAKAAGQPAQAWRALYETALTAQPLNSAAWLEYVKALEEIQAPPAEWLALARRTATAFKEHHEVAWALTDRCLRNGKAQLPTPADRMGKLLELHAILSQKAVPTMYGYNLPAFLNGQAQFIGDDAKAVEFFGKLLVLHHSDKPALNWVFGTTMAWGTGYFSVRPAVSAAYAKAIGGFFEAQGDKGDKAQMASTFIAGIRKASDTVDAPAYHAWLELSAKLLPPLAPADVFLQPAQLAQRPKIEPFPGTLLSATGLLQTSSMSYDKPLSYGQVLGGGELGYFDTANEPKPWAKVVLAGEGELSGIVLVDRYEYAPEKPWDVPLKVETSTDGKTWTEVALLEKQQDVYRVDLQGRNLRAKFVRIERQAQPANGRLHMRNFLVYGKKLY